MSNRKRLPPYGTKLTVRPGRLVRVFAGAEAWQQVKAVHVDALENRNIKNHLLLPPGEAPADYYWPVEGQMVQIIPCGYFPMPERTALAGALIRDGATACQFVDTGEWCGKLPADSFYWQEKAQQRAG